MRNLAIWLLVLVPVLAVPLAGYWALTIAAVLAVAAWRYGRRPSPRATAVGAVVAGLLGASAGVGSAALALAVLGSDPAHAARAPLGWLALSIALAAGVGGVLAPLRPLPASLLLACGALVGPVAMSLFSADTIYPLAGALWLFGSLLALLSRSAE